MFLKFGRIAVLASLAIICVLAAACGGKGYKYPGMELAPDPTDPGSMAVYPQEKGKASLTGKSVVFNSGGKEVPDYVFGGVSEETGAVVSDNTVTVNGGEIKQHAYGGYAQEGKALNNTLTVNDGKMLSAFAGGSRLDSSGNTLYVKGGELRIDRDGDSVFGGYAWGGVANNNKLFVSGGDLPGSIYGGWARKGTSTGNTVTLEGSPKLGATVYAGYVADAQPGEPGQDYVTGNKIFIKNFSGEIPMLRNAELVSVDSTATVIFPDAKDAQIAGVSRLLNGGTIVLKGAPVVWQNVTYFGTGKIVLDSGQGNAGLVLDVGIIEAPLRLDVAAPAGGAIAPFKDRPVVVLTKPVLSKGLDREKIVELVNPTAGGLKLSLKRSVDGDKDIWKLSAE